MIQTINLGQAANDGTGEPLRQGGQKINENFAELDTRVTAAQAKADAAIPSSQRGVASGVATLGADGKLPVSQLPPLAVNEVFTVANQAAMLALTAERGDAAIRTDQNGQWYVLTTDDPSVLGNWKPINQNLGVALTALGALTPAADTIAYFNGPATATTTAFTAKARALLARTDNAGMRTEIAAAGSGANSDITSLSGLTTALSVEQGGTGVKALPVIFTRLRDSQPLTYAEASSERVRMKIFEPINFVTNVDDVSNAQIRGPGYVTTTTTGTIPGGNIYGVLNTTIIPGDVVNQEFVPLSGAAGVTFPAYRRTGYGSSAGRWGPWRMVIDSDSALLDPANGGLMSYGSNANGEYWKFANGMLVCKLVRSVDFAVTNSATGVYFGQSPSWTFPVSFVTNAPFVACSHVSSGVITWEVGNIPGLTSVVPAVVAMQSIASRTFTQSLLAVGRWK